MNDKYCGWRNRETWLVNLWFQPNSPAEVESVKERLETEMEELPPYLQDLCYLSEVDWDQLDQHSDEISSDPPHHDSY